MPVLASSMPIKGDRVGWTKELLYVILAPPLSPCDFCSKKISLWMGYVFVHMSFDHKYVQANPVGRILIQTFDFLIPGWSDPRYFD